MDDDSKNRISLKLEKKRLNKSLILLIVSGLLFGMGKWIPGFSDMYYKYVYFILQNTICRIFSFVPLSVYELIMLGVFAYLIYNFFYYSILLLKKRIKFLEAFKEYASKIVILVSFFVFFNVIGQSVNCFKSSFVSLEGIDDSDINEEKLIKVCEVLRDRLNYLEEKIKKDENGLLQLDYHDVDKEGIRTMENLAKKYKSLDGFYPMPKHYIFSQIMSYQLLQGETTFTIEANYNYDMADSNIPSTICHELSHIQGFNDESEANFISFLACDDSDNYEYKYSGYLMAYVYCINDLYSRNENAVTEINSSLSKNVKKEIKEDANFWAQYKGGISKLYTKVYDALLKAGGQNAGIKSYNNVVKLIVSSYEKEWS
ncbi:DUF3810 domain-containing protein [uncultured Clostridium sp.]|uniref:DUF3810 domain-containing protein n=1 Tax=uncultured Clostridium sp. TaxID=59620 RepID=UPI0025D39A69|nr:DUF3810 domain-containing protein [uncultured Clostridium sp.]